MRYVAGGGVVGPGAVPPTILVMWLCQVIMLSRYRNLATLNLKGCVKFGFAVLDVFLQSSVTIFADTADLPWMGGDRSLLLYMGTHCMDFLTYQTSQEQALFRYSNKVLRTLVLSHQAMQLLPSPNRMWEEISKKIFLSLCPPPLLPLPNIMQRNDNH